MIVYIENPKESIDTKQLLRLISEFNLASLQDFRLIHKTQFRLLHTSNK